jgi:hypothetical protein
VDYIEEEDMNLVEEDKIFVEMEYVEEDFFLIY